MGMNESGNIETEIRNFIGENEIRLDILWLIIYPDDDKFSTGHVYFSRFFK